MTDNEIIKALEIHGNEEFDNCEGCPYLDGDCCTGFSVFSKPYRDVLDLIKRQKAEIERLQKLQKPTGAGGYKIENGKVVFYSDMLNGYRHEYKDLDEVVKELNLYMHTDYKNIELISHYKHKLKIAKSETVKETLLEVDNRLSHYGKYDEIYKYTVTDVLVEVEREMVGEKQ